MPTPPPAAPPENLPVVEDEDRDGTAAPDAGRLDVHRAKRYRGVAQGGRRPTEGRLPGAVLVDNLTKNPMNTSPTTSVLTEEHGALLDVDELARLLNVSKRSAYRLVERRAIRFHRLPGGLRFATRDVDEYLARRRVEPIGSSSYGGAKD